MAFLNEAGLSHFKDKIQAEIDQKKDLQSAVPSPATAEESTSEFIDTVSQDANGVITATKKHVYGTDVPMSEDNAESVGNSVQAIKDWKPTSSGTAGQVLKSKGDGTTEWGAAASQADVNTAVDAYMSAHMSPNQTIALDDSLTSTSSAAQAAAAGNQVLVTDSQPSATTNKVWIKKTPEEEITIPTMDDHNDLKAAVNSDLLVEFGTKSSGTVMLSAPVIQTGDIICYSFDTESGKTGWIGVYNTSDSRVARIGKTDASSPVNHFEGIYTLPANYKRFLTGGTGSITINYLSKTPGVHYDIYLLNQRIDTELSRIDNVNSDIDSVKNLTGITNPTYTENTGYIKTDMSVPSNSTYRYTSPIPVSKGDIVKVVALAGVNISVITLCDSALGNKSLAIAGSNVANDTYTYHVNTNGYVSISYVVADPHLILILKPKSNDSLNEKIEQITDSETFEITTANVGYIKTDKTTASNRHYRYTNPILVSAGKMFSAINAGPVSMAVLASCNSNGVVDEVLVAGENALVSLNYYFDKQTYIIYSWYADDLGEHPTYSIRGKDDVLTKAFISENEASNLQKNATIGMFTDWAVIGDSYSVGAIHTTEATGDDDETVVNNIDLSWEKVLARMLGNNVEYYAVGGMSTQNWVRSDHGSYYQNGREKFNNDTPKQFYVIKLGINDSAAILAGTYTIGTTSDIDLSDPTQCGNTFMGNMGYIIGLIKAKSPQARILILGMADNVDHDGSYQRKTLNQTMKTVADYCSVAYVGEYEDPFFQSDFYWNGYQGGHPTSTVLSGMANAIDRLFARAVTNNYAYFKGFYWDKMVAIEDVAVNKFFRVGDSMYYSTKAITAGDMLITKNGEGVERNCRPQSIIDALNFLRG